jgi:hypothetical protein
MRKGVFVNLLKEANAQCIGDGESCSNDRFGNFIETFAIGAHLRSSAVERLSCLNVHAGADVSEES